MPITNQLTIEMYKYRKQNKKKTKRAWNPCPGRWKTGSCLKWTFLLSVVARGIKSLYLNTRQDGCRSGNVGAEKSGQCVGWREDSFTKCRVIIFFEVRN
jgi:hypothetical protein